MATKSIKSRSTIVDRNIAMVSELTRRMMQNPEILASLPDDFELVILPDDDPELRMYNLDLLDSYGQSHRPIVFARMNTKKLAQVGMTDFDLYRPIAA